MLDREWLARRPAAIGGEALQRQQRRRASHANSWQGREGERGEGRSGVGWKVDGVGVAIVQEFPCAARAEK